MQAPLMPCWDQLALLRASLKQPDPEHPGAACGAPPHMRAHAAGAACC